MEGGGEEGEEALGGKGGREEGKSNKSLGGSQPCPRSGKGEVVKDSACLQPGAL